MSWRAITLDDLLSAVTSYELDTWQTKALADDQADPVPIAISQVTLEVREAIRSCKDNRLDPDAEVVPSGAIRHAVALIRHRLQTRFGSAEEASEDRRMEYRAATSYLTAVAACKISVERYGEDEDTPAPQPRPSITARTRRFTRDDQDGI